MNLRRTIQSSDGPVQLTPKQANIYVWGWQPKARFRDAVCGRRFGKTFLGKAEMRRAARLADRWNVSVEDEIWYCAPTLKQAKRVFWRRLKQAIPLHWRASKPNETELSITLNNGHIIRCVGLNNYDDLRGSGLFFVLIDEWADCPYQAWEEVIRPMLSTCKYTVDGVQHVGGHALRIGTPKGFNHCYDTYSAGQDGREPDHRSWLYTSVDGGNVPPEEIETARRTMDPRTFRQEYLASFENYQGVVYYCFDRKENHTDDTIQPGDELHIGMDFNVGKMAAVVYVMREGLPHAVDELMNKFDTRAMIEEITKHFLGHKILIYPDASGKNRGSSNASESDISLLKDAGFTVKAKDSNPAVKDRVNSVNAMLCNTYGDRRMKVNTKKCPKFTQCLERQVYADSGEPDKKGGFDHGNDAGGYPIVYLFALKIKEAFSTNMGSTLG
ncbi:terminase large subunit domain-containing protein [Serratia fonticola]|uniref:phage terminase large subunit family protein n=1 Tax=Serratia fonticola TaxID=47917 RepID=UPI0027EE9CF6|nr:terminase family protein [Serratia fonticola]MDQ7207400.1 terminase family protein [Serratia fonticola]HBE9077635.1 terminase family protein [Serratia fonticola]HBE9088206.1 terminase family protein [Serratia fonticola]HBE9150364.1 terminase family protein [Serratia fonticola]